MLFQRKLNREQSVTAIFMFFAQKYSHLLVMCGVNAIEQKRGNTANMSGWLDALNRYIYCVLFDGYDAQRKFSYFPLVVIFD